MTNELTRRTVLGALAGLPVAIALAGGPSPAAATAVRRAVAASGVPPVLYPEQLRNAHPGCALQVSGWGFEPGAQVRLWDIPTDLTMPPVTPPALPVTPPTAAATLSAFGLVGESLATVPPATARSVSALYVSSGDGTAWAAPLLMNAAEPWFASRSSVPPGGVLTVVGVNLSVAGSTPVVYLDNAGTLIGCAVSVVSDYEIDVTIPSSVGAGSYPLLISNGLGGHYGYSRAVAAVVAASVAPAGSLSVLTYGADPTGVADSTAAIQSAITAAAAFAGGATVAFGAGTFEVSGRITVPAATVPVHLVGAGSASTTIRMSDTSTFGADFPLSTATDVYGVAATDQKSLFYLDAANGPVRIEGMTVDCNDRRAVGIGINRRNNTTLSDVVVICNDYPADVWLRTGANAVFIYGARNAEIVDCVLDGNVCINSGAIIDARFERNVFKCCFPRVAGAPNHPQRQADNTAVKLFGAKRVVMRENSFERSSTVYYYARGMISGGSRLASFSYGASEACGVEDIILSRNSISDVGEPNSNNGEAFVGDTFTAKPGERSQLGVASATATTVSVVGAPFDTASSNDVIGAYIYILAGTGAGQVRRVASHTTSVLTVATPWAVQPDTTSIISVVLSHARQLYIDNEVTACSKYLGNYGPSFASICANNSFDGTGAVPNASSGVDQGIGIASSLRSPAPTFDYKLQFYNEISDNEINVGRTFMSYTRATGGSHTPAGPIARANSAVRNTVSNGDECVLLYTGGTSLGAVWGRFNLLAANVAASGTTDEAVIGDGFDHTYFQGSSGALSDSGSNTVLV